MKKWNLVIGKETKARVLSVLLAVTMSMSLFGCGKTASDESAEAASTAAEQVEQETAEQEKADGVSHSSESGKDETVYVIADAAGSPTKVIVSNQLKNKDGADSLKDTTTLKDITNVNGDGSYKENADGTITWDTDGGADVYYQGTTDKELPVTVKLSYQLDGKDIKPEDLAGKSGHVKIRFEYTNNATKKVKVGDKEEEIKVPFCMTSGAVLPNDTFSNVTVTNGRIINEGKNNIVVGVAFPGLTESLDWDNMKSKAKDEEARKKLDDIDIPESVEIEADVKNFALDMTLTMASSNVLSSFNLTKDIDTSEISDQMDDLQDGMDKLIDGGEDLKDGTGKVKDGASDLNDGAGKLKDGTGDLKDGAGKLKDGTSELKDGAGELADGTQSLADGAGKLQSGAQELANGTTTLKSGSSALVSGVEKLKSGTESLNSGVGKLQSGAGTLKAGTASLVENSGKLQAGAEKLDSGADNLNKGVSSLGSNLGTIKGYSNQLAVGLSTLKQQTSAFNSVDGSKMKTGLGQMIAGLYKLQTVVNSMKSSIGDGSKAGADTLQGIMNQIIQVTSGKEDSLQAHVSSAASDMGVVMEDLAKQSSNLDDVKNTIDKNIAELSIELNDLEKYPVVTQDDINQAKSALDTATVTYQNAASAYATVSAAFQAQKMMSETPSAGAKEAPIASTWEEEDDEKTQQSPEEEKTVDGSTTADKDATSPDQQHDAATNSGTDTDNADTGVDKSEIPIQKQQVGEDTSNTDSNNVPAVSTDEAVTATEGSTDGDDSTTVMETSPKVSNDIDVTVTQKDVDDALGAMMVAKTAMTTAQETYTNLVQQAGQRSALEAQLGFLQNEKKDLKNAASGPQDLSSIITNASKVQTDISNIAADTGKLKLYEAAESSGLQSLYGTLAKTENEIGTSIDNAKGQVQSAVQTIDQLSQKLPDLANGIEKLSDGATGLDNGIARLQNEGIKPLSEGAGALKDGTAQLKDGTQQLTAGAGKLDSGASQLKDGLDTLAKGAGDLDSGAGTLKTGAGQLDEGIGKVQSGAATLSTGTSDLKSGADKVNEGAGSLKTGADKLDSGTADLYDGAVQLDDGASDLYDGTVQLLDGTGSLDDGAQELLDGLNKYNKEGIQKLTELFGDNVQDVLDRLQAVTEAGDDYNSFSGALPVQSGDDKNGGNAVKFIYRTDSIKAD